MKTKISPENLWLEDEMFFFIFVVPFQGTFVDFLGGDVGASVKVKKSLSQIKSLYETPPFSSATSYRPHFALLCTAQLAVQQSSQCQIWFSAKRVSGLTALVVIMVNLDVKKWAP